MFKYYLFLYIWDINCSFFIEFLDIKFDKYVYKVDEFFIYK